MKKAVLPICLGCFLLIGASCSKSKALSSIVAGTWEIRSSQQSIVPTIFYPAGNDSIIKFTNLSYSVYSKGQIVKSGTYTILDDTANVVIGQFSHRIIYDGNSSIKIYLQVSGNELTFISGDPAVDSGSLTTYEKQ